MTRNRCTTKGHVWFRQGGAVQFCKRWLCGGRRVDPDYPMSDSLRAELREEIGETA